MLLSATLQSVFFASALIRMERLLINSYKKKLKKHFSDIKKGDIKKTDIKIFFDISF